MLDGEVTKLSVLERRKLRNIVLLSGLGGAVLGLVGYYTIGPGYAELLDGDQQAPSQHSVVFDFPTANPFDSLESR